MGTRCSHNASLVQPGGKPRGATPPCVRPVRPRAALAAATRGGGVVGVEYLAEALCGRDGGAHDLRIGGRKREGRGGGRRRDSGHAGHAARARTLPRTSASNRSGMRESRQSKWSFQSAACAAIAHSFTAGPPQRPLHTCTRSTLTQTSHALCDIRAILVGIVRKSCRRGQHATFCARLRQTAPGPIPYLLPETRVVGYPLGLGPSCRRRRSSASRHGKEHTRGEPVHSLTIHPHQKPPPPEVVGRMSSADRLPTVCLVLSVVALDLLGTAAAGKP